MTRSLGFGWTLSLGAALFSVACSGADAASIVPGSSSGQASSSSAAAAAAAGPTLFDAPSSTKATPDSLFGLWGGELQPVDGWQYDIRLRLTEGTMTSAQRCTSPDGATGGVASVSASARIADDTIDVLESKDDAKTVGAVTCRVAVRPQHVPRCPDDAFTLKSKCFELSGTQLTLYGANDLDKEALTKIGD